ncbi:2-succinyl-6-hydroxy-2,4-cyclohexadiene-1-carboxylate synthase [Alkalibacillus aidingensis]|uniref:2-succinyl-6-hydroxy-2, 4-cyclohexadiene-1-carboxylate synthase n=1 Tax=Alkalibacillus aidingensis TaxID=2747607 RepID=UPI001660616F|nr:2-succinyl-6-hydroxy-2,4-cyclohexadiene-1-carboxylate synthase [Alkalibacillus aidingensis]
MYYQVGNNKYYVETEGQGEPLVLFHGFTGTTSTWDQLKEQLKEHYQLILIDLPGHGLSITYALEGMNQACDELRAVIQQMGISTFNLLGYSMGGRTALVFAWLFPNIIDKLILVGASPGLEGEEQDKRVQQDEKLACYIEQNGLQTFVDYWEKIPLFETQEHLPNDAKERIRHERLNQKASGLALSLRTMGTGIQPSLWGELTNIDTPSLLITGELDQKFTNLNQKMCKLLPNAGHQIVSGAGHAVHLENPEIFGKIVLSFLKQ